MHDAVRQRHRWGKHLGCVMTMVLPWKVIGQGAIADTGSEVAIGASRTLLQTFPPARPLGVAPPVSTIGTFVREDGTIRVLPATAVAASVDLRWYDNRLLSVFPPSGDHYPSDSLISLQKARARAWVDRLQMSVSSASAGARSGTTGRQAVPFARVAARAGDEALARQIIDARLAALQDSPLEQSYVLSEAVTIFADQNRDSVRLVQSLPIAEAYAVRLRAISTGGYRTVHDSTIILYRQIGAEDSLRIGYAAIGAGLQIVRYAKRAMMLSRQLGPAGCYGFLYEAYRGTAFSLADQLHRDALLDSLNSTVREVVRLPMRWPPEISQAQRISLSQRAASEIEGVITEMQARLASIRALASSIPAHAWLNSSDSVWRQTARSRAVDDGRIRVLLFCGLTCNNLWPALERIQRLGPPLEGVFVTMTRGAVGPDLVDPATEIEWLRAYYVTKRHFTMPIAVWAGPKVPVTQPEGLQGFVPSPSPTGDTEYRNGWTSCVVVDGHGKIRAWVDLDSRAAEARLQRRLKSLLAESTASQ